MVFRITEMFLSLYSLKNAKEPAKYRLSTRIISNCSGKRLRKTALLMLTIFGAVAELEREYILQRQAEGIAIAKQQGVYHGRRPIVHPDFEKTAALWRERKITATEAMKRLNMKPSTFYRKVKELRL